MTFAAPGYVIHRVDRPEWIVVPAQWIVVDVGEVVEHDY